MAFICMNKLHLFVGQISKLTQQSNLIYEDATPGMAHPIRSPIYSWLSLAHDSDLILNHVMTVEIFHLRALVFALTCKSN